MMDKIYLNQLKWACRRGMLELDLLLTPFLEQHFYTLSNAQKKDFEYLLTQDDTDLYAWFMGHEKSNEPRIEKTIALIHHALSSHDKENSILTK